jgi:hypothetical protein
MVVHNADSQPSIVFKGITRGPADRPGRAVRRDARHAPRAQTGTVRHGRVGGALRAGPASHALPQARRGSAGRSCSTVTSTSTSFTPTPSTPSTSISPRCRTCAPTTPSSTRSRASTPFERSSMTAWPAPRPAVSAVVSQARLPRSWSSPTTRCSRRCGRWPPSAPCAGTHAGIVVLRRCCSASSWTRWTRRDDFAPLLGRLRDEFRTRPQSTP